MERCIWQFKSVGTDVEAFVVAADYDLASDLFGPHLRVNGGDPDNLMFRELELHHLDEDAEVMVREALALKRDGLVIHDDTRGWLFVMPLVACPGEG